MSRYLGVPARVLLLIAALSIVPAVARADYIYTVTQTFIHSTQFSFIEPTLASSGTVTSSLTQISGTTATAFVWDSAAGGFCFGGGFPDDACAGIEFVGGGQNDFGFPAGSFLASGTYTSVLPGMTVNITQTGVPEPSSLLLLGSGILGLLGTVRRKLKG